MSKTPETKSDSNQGLRVRNHLVNLGLETPLVDRQFDTLEGPHTKADIARILEDSTYAMMKAMGLDLRDDSLQDTPKRVAKMWMNELYWGLDYSNFPKMTLVENKMNYDEMLLERNITVNSTCEHHLLPILGNAWVAYIPSDKVLGISKINRVVEFFARRPQIQERLTAQIFHTLSFLLETEDVAVCIAAEHMCVKTRGVEDACSDTVTSKLGGAFQNSDRVRAEFYSLFHIGTK